MFDRDRARTLIEGLLEAEGVPLKALKVGPSGSILATFHGEESARKAAELFTPFARSLRVADGLDDAKAADPRAARRRHVHVWRVAGLIGA